MKVNNIQFCDQCRYNVIFNRNVRQEINYLAAAAVKLTQEKWYDHCI